MDVKINLEIITKNNAADTEIAWGKIFEMNLVKLKNKC